MMKKLEHFNEIHSLEMPDQLSLDRINCFSTKTMEKTKRNKPELYYFFFLASLTDFLSRGLSQYGLLHNEQFLGNTDFPDSSSRGHHLCSHRRHSNCSTSTFLPNSVFMSIISIYYLVNILYAVNNIYPTVYSIDMKTVQTKQEKRVAMMTMALYDSMMNPSPQSFIRRVGTEPHSITITSQSNKNSSLEAVI